MTSFETASASPAVRGGLVERIARSTLYSGLSRLKVGQLTVHETGEAARVFGGEAPGPEATVHVHDPAFFRRMLLDGELGAGESYIRGEWWSPSPMDVVQLGIVNRRQLKQGSPLFWLGAVGAWLAHQTRSNTQDRARENIHAHYDLGNDFFQLFLDPSMTYSCAYFEDEWLAREETGQLTQEDLEGDEALQAAQTAKYRRIAYKAGVRPGDHVLEIGCGWGGFAELLATEFGCSVTGVTISNEQAAYAKARIAAAGLDDRVNIEVVDYRKIEGQFDRIVSVEMLEAVGHRFLPAYFGACDRLLAPGGKAVIQVITIPDNRYFRYRWRPDYIQKFIFPGAHLPSLGAMKRALRRTRLRIADKEDLAPHYGPTLAIWRRRFLRRANEVKSLGFDDAFVRRWEFYFAYCEAAFRTNYVADWHLVLDREEAS